MKSQQPLRHQHQSSGDRWTISALEWEPISSWNSDKAKEGGDDYPLRTRSGLPIFSGAFCYGCRTRIFRPFEPKDSCLGRRLQSAWLHKNKFLLMPTVDHEDPNADTLEFEIVSWLVNDGKSGLDPEQFVDLCRRIVAHRGKQKRSKNV